MYARAGKIKHDFVFFLDDGRPIRSLNYFYKRWRYSVEKLKFRYREPYAARHCSVSWNLMIGKNLLWCSQNHGHSAQAMLTIYGRWINGSTEADVELSKCRCRQAQRPKESGRPLPSPRLPAQVPPKCHQRRARTGGVA